jgi:hypothetical protein
MGGRGERIEHQRVKASRVGIARRGLIGFAWAE